MLNKLNKFFKIQERGSSFTNESLAGLTTFITMSYVIIVNPTILAMAGMDKAALITITSLVSCISCLIMGIFANLPIAVAPTMGTNSYFALVLCLGIGLTWQEGLSLVFYNGIIFLIISLTGIREKIIKSIPKCLQIGLQCGIGLFIAFIGLQGAKLVESNSATIISGSPINNCQTLLCLFGILLLFILIAKKIRFSIIITICLITFVSFFLDDLNGEKISQLPKQIFSFPSSISSTFMQVDFLYPFNNLRKALPLIFILLMVDMLDTIGTLIALGRKSGLMDKNGNMDNLGKALASDSIATIIGSLFGTSTTGAYIESSTGIELGAKTGFSNIIVAIMFFLCMFISPLILAVPAIATAPALIIVGVMMMQSIKDLSFEDFKELIPCVFTMLMITFTFKISEGFAFGLIAYVLICIFTKNVKKINLTTWIMTIFMGLFLASL